MRFAAGVLLIIAAIFNGCAASAYRVGGAASAVAGKAASDISAELVKAGASQADGAKVIEAAQTAAAASSGMVSFSYFLMAMVALQIAGGVLLFVKKARAFLLLLAVLTIAAEVIGISMTKFGVSNLPGVLAGILTGLAAWGFKATAPQAAPPPATAAGA